MTDIKCRHCGGDQLDYQSINLDSYRCRKCGQYTSGLEMAVAWHEERIRKAGRETIDAIERDVYMP
jgi:DNA-directed RNA polymerase subunit RPC12/RpoP